MFLVSVSAAVIPWLAGGAAFVGQLTQRVSIGTNGAEANSASFSPSMSADGRYVAFDSAASNLVAGDRGWWDVFVRDRQSGTTERISVSTSGGQSDGASQVEGFSISADGGYVVFVSYASNLVPNDTNAINDVFLRDRQAGTTELISVSTAGVQGNGGSAIPSISADGRFVVFESYATNLVTGDTNGNSDIFLRDRLNGTTQLVSLSTNGTQGNGGSYLHGQCSISADGRYVTFFGGSTNFVSGDTNGAGDVFVRDLLNGVTERVSVSTGGAEGNDQSLSPSISADARYVTFESYASNFVANDANLTADIFVRDRLTGTTVCASVATSGMTGHGYSEKPSISPDGRFVAFDSNATNLVTGDTNQDYDAFVRDTHADGFTSLCDPGSDGVATCPCSNPPSGTDRGCDNSSATGGASLSASGVAYVSMDSLVFTTSGEKPTATSILLQGTAVSASGVVYGQGVRCVGGTLRRLFVKLAVGGSITAPDFGAGDPAVSARSAVLGNPIGSGETRWYLVFYRDPTVLGGCPATSTFNATQTARVDWSF